MSVWRSSLLLRLLCFTLLVGCGIVQLRYAVVRQIALIGKSSISQAESSGDVYALTRKAKELHLFEADMAGAELLLQTALTASPLFVPAWLSLAELHNDGGSRERAWAILEYVDQLTEGIKRWRWDKALLDYQIGRVEFLPDELRFIISEVSGKSRNDALTLAFSLWSSPAELLERMGEENIPHLFLHAVQVKEPDKALFFWRLLEDDAELWSDSSLLALFDMLITTDRIADARPIWEKYYAHGALLYNGDFSRPVLQRA